MTAHSKTPGCTGEMPLITVVVPIYDTQDYLPACLDSIREQSYQNLEILLIDDGSTDDTAWIASGFCRADPRFRLIQQENVGLGPARNTGLSQAKGTYICFVDSDDLLHPDFVRMLYENLITYDADLSICRFQTFDKKAPIWAETKKQEKHVQVFSQQELLKALLTDDPVNTMVAWNKLMAVSWLKGFHFENKWHEDQFMINEYIRRCRKAVVTSAILYAYRERPDSIMGKNHSQDLRHLDDLEAHRQRIRYFYRPRYKPLWKDLFLADLNNQIEWYRKLYTKENAGLLREQIYPTYAWGFRQYLRLGGPFRKNGSGARLLLFRLSPRLYITLRKLLKSRRS